MTKRSLHVAACSHVACITEVNLDLYRLVHIVVCVAIMPQALLREGKPVQIAAFLMLLRAKVSARHCRLRDTV